MFASLKQAPDELGRIKRYRSVRDAGFKYIPTDGLVFYVPLQKDADTAATGQELAKLYSPVQFPITTRNQIPCSYFGGESYIRTTTNGIITGSVPRTVSFWAEPEGTQTYCCAVGLGGIAATGRLFNCGLRLASGYVRVQFTAWGIDIDDQAFYDDDRLHHFCYIYDPSYDQHQLQVWIDGNFFKYYDVGILNTSDAPFSLGRSGGGQWFYNGYLAAVRVYNRIPTTEEIKQLAGEFQ